MAFVTDPDNLDRWQIVVNPISERISVRGLGTSRSSQQDTGESAGTTTFTDTSNGDFVTDSVAAGDILTILNGDGAGHYEVQGSIDATSFTVDTSISGTASNLTYRIDEPQATSQSGEAVADGLTMQSLYSFLKEEWRTLGGSLGNAPDLIQFVFPLESITREQFEIGGPTHGDWDFADNTTRNLLRTGGWAQIDSTGTTQTEYAGIITLGSIDSDAQVYYQQGASAAPTNFVLTGPVNQSILTFTDGGSDNRTFLKLFVRKKARSYAQSEIADIGVTSIETIVNRFPLAHAIDAAISTNDGNLRQDSPFGTVVSVNTATSGSGEGVADVTSGDGLFEFDDAGADFQGANDVYPGDVIEFTSGNLSGNVYEIQSVVDGSNLVLFEEPGDSAISDETAVSYETKTRYIVAPGTTDGVNADATADDTLGELTSATVGDFAAAGVSSGDYIRITEGGTAGSGIIGVYKIDSVATTTLSIDITDNENWSTGTGIDFEILEPGMFLQNKSVSASTVTASGGRTLTFADANPDTITASSGSFITDGYVHGMAITVAGTTNNNGTFIVDSVDATSLTLIDSDTLVAEGPLSATATIDGEVGFVRTLNQVDYPFGWRLFGNNGTLNQCFEFIQRELRRATDVDESDGTSRGDVTDLLMTFASPTGTGLDLFIDDLAASDTNNATFRDVTDNSRNFAFIAGVTVTLNDNIKTSSSAKVVIFFTNDDAGADSGADFGTPNAIVVQDDVGSDMTAINPSADLSFNFDYDNNVQRGGGSAATNAPVTIVAIGTDTAQYVQATGTIQRQNNNTFALVAALERNYDNP